VGDPFVFVQLRLTRASDAGQCPVCGGQMRLLAFIAEGTQTRRAGF
jgi:hypothetical protein